MVVPLVVDAGGDVHTEGDLFTSEDALLALRRGQRLVTSSPPPAAFEAAYAQAAADGAAGVISVHLSGELSGTVHAAAYAASRAPIPVRVVDSRTVAMGLGFAVRAAATCAWSGAGIDAVARRAARVADRAHTTFLVDSLDHLRRSGRLSPAAAVLGTALGMRPILAVQGGRLEVAGRVRGQRAALDRLVGDALAAVSGCTRPAWAVQVIGAHTLATQVADRLTQATGIQGETMPVGAVLAAHVGPAVVAITVADLADEA